MATTTTRRRAAAKPAPEPEVVEDEFEDVEDETTDDLEELEEDEAPVEEAPKPKAKRNTSGLAKAQAAREATKPKFGSAELAAYVSEATGETYDSRGVRMLLRKLAKDGSLDRVVGETRDRYSFSGPDDPTVQAIVTMIKDGTAKALKQEGLEKVKTEAAARKAAAKAAKAAAAAEESDDEDMEEVEEAPAPKPRRTAAKAAAPAKAAPSTRRRTATK